jgi:hypothetical protein
MSTSPEAIPVTTPLALTLAMVASDELHAAAFVMVGVVPSESVAVAENGAAAPTAGGEPTTATETTVGVVGVPEPEVGAVVVGDSPPVQAISRQAGISPARSVPLCATRWNNLTFA